MTRLNISKLNITTAHNWPRYNFTAPPAMHHDRPSTVHREGAAKQVVTDPTLSTDGEQLPQEKCPLISVPNQLESRVMFIAQDSSLLSHI